MTNILLNGIATLDIINQLDHYPEEDSEVRALTQTLRIGGNAANSSIVLQQLGVNAHLIASRADDSNAKQVFSQLNERKINTDLCPVHNNSSTPTSYITLNSHNGSRSIIHYRDLTELQASYYIKLNLSQYNWLHFESRDCKQQLKMLQYAQTFKLPISIELEKNRKAIETIIPFADLLLISKPFAESQGFDNAYDCIKHYSQRYSDKTITCTWGKQGAWAYANSSIIHQDAFPLDKTIETLGAGDTFNAGIIYSLIKQKSLSQTLKFACRLAANKCMQSGFDHLIIPADH
ncbi:MAG: ketohexokinase [endosymbiont of Galathealinum brachiosum]|uniref:Ketohexokinase n=1 Tax=endosymbiont of Galathealinum brachiosum TaxID=2200906 RepID=A0A370DCU3_9GAMM|nr:MAG: ketohexokinase [endosymbiont of Galathealinum brachiosum]